VRHLLAVPVIAGVLLTGAACSSTGSAPNSTTGADIQQVQSSTPSQTGSVKQAQNENAKRAQNGSAKQVQTGGTKQAQGGDDTFPIGPGAHMVLLHSFDTARHAAVIEPAVLRDGSQFCALHHRPASDSRCTREAVIDADGSRYTLPVSPSVKLFSTNGGNPDCMNGSGFHTTGSCMTTVSKIQPEVARSSGGLLVEISNTDKFIYEMSEVYTP
jgi:hypothetical protein